VRGPLPSRVAAEERRKQGCVDAVVPDAGMPAVACIRKEQRVDTRIARSPSACSIKHRDASISGGNRFRQVWRGRRTLMSWPIRRLNRQRTADASCVSTPRQCQLGSSAISLQIAAA